MRSLDWLTAWVIGALAATALTATAAWLLDQPRRSGRRPTGWAAAVLIVTATAATLLALGHTARWWPPAVLGAGLLAAAVLHGRGVRVRARLRATRRARLHPPASPADRHLRPQRDPVAHRPGWWPRVERWLAADGPAPTAGWWHSGGLVLDDRGPALLDAAGLRHPLPATTTAMVLRPAPRALLLLDARHDVLARLPLTGFTPAGLRDYCAAAGWAFHPGVLGDGVYRPAPDVLDLQRAVIDPAAR